MPRLPRTAQTVFTLCLALAAALACVRLGTPIPWMMGPLVATALVGVLGGPVASAVPLRNAGQWVIAGKTSRTVGTHARVRAALPK